MPVRITNRSRSLVTVPLNTGDSLHLAPGEVSEPIEDFQVDDNRWVTALLERGTVALERPRAGGPARGRRKKT